ncbi:hypothetical protein [Cytobacillus firmus]|uniref:hypothetical protein n=1 Tax=Cytobacillus firmus TaxID=1399 RepID=UPI0018CF0BAA|nr:hypothetical protein [Cytobacillus firmus]MBG9590198.1 hypothetical protein [Cytobacillus firmus]
MLEYYGELCIKIYKSEKSFANGYEKIEVPQEGVLKAIKTGITRASSIEKPNRNKKRLRS